MKKLLKKYLFMPVVITMPFILLSCKVVKENKIEDNNRLINSSNPEEIKRQLNEIQLNVVQLDEYKSNKSQIKASSISSVKNVILKAEDPSLRDKVKIEVENIKNADDSSGELTLTLKISYENTSINKDLTIPGFRKSNDGFIDLKFEERFAPNPSKFQEYIDQDLYNQFKLDNKKYVDNFLSGYINYVTNKNPQDWRKNIERNPELIEKYNEIANKLHLDTFNDALIKGFALPQLENGKRKLSLYTGNEVGKAPGWSDIYNHDVNKAYGVPRVFPNEKYRDYSLDTYSVTFNWPDERKNKENNSQNYILSTHGTMWTMDFQIRGDKKYPTKWYFGTNMHVADTFTDKVINIAFSNIKDNVGINTKLPLLNGDRSSDFFNNYYLELDKAEKGAANVVFEAKDFLRVDPAEYLVADQKEKYKNFKEMLDFAVIEIDFEKLSNSKPAEFKDVEEWVRAITHNYADKKERHIKFLSESYLKNYDKAKYSLDINKAIRENSDTFYIVGYPISTNDWGLKMYVDKDYDPNTRRFKKSLWINGESSFFESSSLPPKPNDNSPITPEQFKWASGNRFSSNLAFRTFGDKPGLLDAFIGFPKISNEKKDDFYTKNNKDGTKSYFINFGLEYSPRHFSPEPGASGSVIRNQKNELIGVFHSKNAATNSGLAAAFRSEGFNYQGLYGDYNLPQYDLIYGGAIGQTNSYRETLKKLYGNLVFKTNLFKNGLDEIPEKFKFEATEKTAVAN
ncbi:hypothetical protein HGG64_00855 [Mycoplasma phocoeninasale]|uniref:DUF31 domain-containing protein n=1 Tax=Mycoplasma phocoeninasale TaxID=2726117 RepID=A0A858TZN6_9MOLU|nr:lipoprotein 17-related variable surface protein [Mycoplasma phocoeninasale]QJG66264.1 hypothetical protein HGG64_00855 [Mycoplasma phocoeninasale]